MAEDLFGFINNFYSKATPLNTETTISPFIVNRFLALHKPNTKICNELNKYTFWIPKNLWYSIMYYSIPKQKQPWVQFTKKSKKDEKLLFWRDSLKRYFNWSERELKQNIGLIDEEEKRRLVKAFGFDKKQAEQLGVKIEQVKIEIKDKKPITNLEQWMG